MGERLEGNREIFKKVNDSSGDMNKAFQSVTNTLDFKYNQALANVKVGLIEIGMSMKSSIIPILETMGNTVRGLANWYTNLGATQKQLILTTTALLAVIGPVSITLSIMAKLFANLTTVGGIAINIFNGLRVAMISTPWGAIAVGLTAAIVAFANWNKTTDRFREIQSEVNTQLSEEVFKLNSVFEKLKSANLSTQQRADILKIVNERYGDYIGYLLTEKSTLGDIEKAQTQATNALVASISLKTYRAKLEEEMTGISQSFDKYFSDFTSNFSKTYGGDRVGEFITGIFEGADKALKQGNPLQVSQDLYDQFVETMSKRTGYLKYSIEDFRKAFLNFVEAKGEKNQVVDQINAMISAYEKLSITQKKNAEPIKSIVNSRSLRDEVKNSKFILEQYGASLETIASKMKLTDPIEELQYNIDALNYRKLLMFASDVGTPMQQLNKELADLALRNAAFGDTLETAGNQADLVKQKIISLQNDGIRQGNPIMDAYIQKWRELTIVQMKADATFRVAKQGLDQISQAFSNIKSIEDFGNAIVQAAKNIILAVIAEAVAINTAKAVQQGKSWWGALIQGAAAMAATEALFATLPKFAEGGTVPPGYPNDSYPAMLTSGEKVIPPQKLDKISRSSNNIHVTVGGEISGENIRLMLKRVERRHVNNYGS